MVDVPHQIPHPGSVSALPFYQSTALKKNAHNDVTRSDLFLLNSVHIFKIFINIWPKIVHRSTSQVTNTTLTILTGYAVQGHVTSTASSHFPTPLKRRVEPLKPLIIISASAILQPDFHIFQELKKTHLGHICNVQHFH